ncbi:hypothetical protein, partial [Bartonella sp. MM73XJBT]|uniref:hypothetical protein n=1 Tax=Bartonella sp. MM73XJBT TaxID=3019095 RepID=UPI00235DE9E6
THHSRTCSFTTFTEIHFYAFTISQKAAPTTFSPTPFHDHPRLDAPNRIATPPTQAIQLYFVQYSLSTYVHSIRNHSQQSTPPTLHYAPYHL